MASEAHKDIKKVITVRRVVSKTINYEVQHITLTPANMICWLAETREGKVFESIAKHWDTLDVDGQRALFNEMAEGINDVEEEEEDCNDIEVEDDNEELDDVSINYYIDSDESGYGDRFNEELTEITTKIAHRLKSPEELLRDEHEAIQTKSCNDVKRLDERIESLMLQFRKSVETLRKDAEKERQKENKRLDEINLALLALKKPEPEVDYFEGKSEPVKQITLDDLLTGKA